MCASASLEPFDGAMAQLRRDGPDEAAVRMRRCLEETIFYHAPAAILADLDTHSPHILQCYRSLKVESSTTKADLVYQLVQCLSATPVSNGCSARSRTCMGHVVS